MLEDILRSRSSISFYAVVGRFWSGETTISSHRQLEQLLRGFNAAYNARRQRVLEGKPQGRAGLCKTAKARLIATR